MSITRDLSSQFSYQQYVKLDSSVIADFRRFIDCTGSRTCSAVKGYREIIRNGGNATGPYTLDAYTVKSLKEGSFGLNHTGSANPPFVVNTQLIKGIPANVFLPTVLSTSAVKAEAIALSKIYKKIKQEQEQLNLLASLAEIGDVIRQFGRPAEALVDLTHKYLDRLEYERRNLRGSKFAMRIKWSQILASTWLEYAFGLAPLISDTRNVAEAFARFNFAEELSKLTPRVKVSSRGEDEASSVSQTSGTFSSTYIMLRSVTQDKSVSRCQYVCGLSASRTADFGSNAALLQLLGVTPGNLLPAAWEAVPWSWLADYFSNIGNILDASVTSTASVTWICKTVSSRHSRKVTISTDEALTAEKVKSVGRKVVSQAPGQASYETVRTVLNRTIPASLGIPSLYFEYPTQVGQLANMVAVLFSRKEKVYSHLAI